MQHLAPAAEIAETTTAEATEARCQADTAPLEATEGTPSAKVAKSRATQSAAGGMPESDAAVTAAFACKTYTYDQGLPQRATRVSLTVPDQLHGDYGLYTWPSARVLAEYVWHARDTEIRGRRVVELGMCRAWIWMVNTLYSGFD